MLVLLKFIHFAFTLYLYLCFLFFNFYFVYFINFSVIFLIFFYFEFDCIGFSNLCCIALNLCLYVCTGSEKTYCTNLLLFSTPKVYFEHSCTVVRKSNIAFIRSRGIIVDALSNLETSKKAMKKYVRSVQLRKCEILNEWTLCNFTKYVKSCRSYIHS